MLLVVKSFSNGARLFSVNQWATKISRSTVYLLWPALLWSSERSHSSNSRWWVRLVVVFKTHYCCRHVVKLVGDRSVGLTVSLLMAYRLLLLQLDLLLLWRRLTPCRHLMLVTKLIFDGKVREWVTSRYQQVTVLLGKYVVTGLKVTLFTWFQYLKEK